MQKTTAKQAVDMAEHELEISRMKENFVKMQIAAAKRDEELRSEINSIRKDNPDAPKDEVKKWLALRSKHKTANDGKQEFSERKLLFFL